MSSLGGKSAETADATNDSPIVTPDDPAVGLPDELSELDIVVVRDPIDSGGGGIEVVANIARFLDAPIYTYRQSEQVSAYQEIEVNTFGSKDSLGSRLARRFGLRRALTLFEINEYENWSPPEEADIVVTAGTRSQHVIHHAHQQRIHFFFTPARWLWDLTHGQWDGWPRPVRRAMLVYASYVRSLDMSSSHRFDAALAGSELVKKRVETYYGLDSSVAYCPIDTFAFEPNESNGYYVMLTRIVPEKRVKLVIEACNELNLPLKIAGTSTGSSQEYAKECQKLADDTVDFLGWIEGADKQNLLAKSKSLIFAAKREDFGMPPVEAMASGKPVVGVNEGYTQHQITDGEDGVLFEPTHDCLVDALQRAESTQWNPAEIQHYARQYDVRAVRRQWLQTIRRVISQ